MKHLRVHLSRMDAIGKEIASLAKGVFEPLVQDITTTFVPVYINGVRLDVSKQVKFQPIVGDFRTYDSSFMLKTGSTDPVTTYRGDDLNVLSQLNDLSLEELSNPSVEDDPLAD